MSNKILLFIVIILTAINRSYTLRIGECEIDDSSNANDLTNSQVTGVLSITIDDVDELNNVYSTTGDLKLKVENDAAQTAADYVDITLADNTFKIMTNDKFKNNFESDKMNEPASDAMTIAVTFSLCCGVDCADAGAPQTFSTTLRLTVTDTNNHPPTFTAATYTYKLPSPLAPGVDLTSAGTEISVTDLDFSNTDVTFTVEPADNFIVETINRGGREYRGVLKVNKYTNLFKTTSLTITATDSGNPVQSTTATVEINVDSENSLSDKPSLSQGLYRFDYNAKDSSLTPAEGQEIKITTTSSGDVTVQIRDDAGAESPYFKADYDSSTGLVTVESTDNKLELSSDPVLVLQLVAFYTGNEEDSSKSVILIQLPSELVATGPKFSAAYYQTTYKILDDGPSLDPVTITVTDKNAVVTLDDDTNFSLKKADDNKDEWTVVISKSLDEAALKKGEDIVLILTATVTQDDGNLLEGQATLIIQLPQAEQIKVPKFTKTLYLATYEEDEYGTATVNLEKDDKIEASSSEGHSVKIEIDSSEPAEATGYFTITDEGKVNVQQYVPAEDLKTGAEYRLVLKATVTDGDNVDPGYGILLITIPAPTIIPSPRFTKTLYTATYSKSSDENEFGVVTLDDDKISATSDGQTVDIKADSFQPPEGQYYFELTEDLEINVLAKPAEEGEYVIILEASISGNSEVDSAYSTLVIEVSGETGPEFEKNYYTGVYKFDNSSNEYAVEIIDGPITLIDSGIHNIRFESSEFMEYFSIVQNGSHWKIIIIKPLPSKILESESVLLLNLIASKLAVDTVGEAVLIIKLPKQPTSSFFFDNIAYVANYVTDVANPSLIIENEVVIVSNDGFDGISVEIRGDYEDYFTVYLDPTTGKLNVSIIKLIENSILQTEIAMTLYIEATKNSEKAEAVLVIKLPKVTTSSTIYFENTIYVANYSEKSISLKLLGDEDSSARITLEGDSKYTQYLEVERQKFDTIEVTIKNLPSDILEEEAIILIDVVATLDSEITKTTLLIKLPRAE